MRCKSNLVDIDVDRLVHQTDGAYLFRIGGEKVWIPKACCEYNKDEDTVTMEEEYATEKGLV